MFAFYKKVTLFFVLILLQSCSGGKLGNFFELTFENIKEENISDSYLSTADFISTDNNDFISQDNNDFIKLIGYCIKNEHWSDFEQAYMTIQIETTRGIAAQILRHRSFTFQEFSQRYADSTQLGDIPIPELRRQDNKNRQNSISDLSDDLITKFNKKMEVQFNQSKKLN